MQRFQALLIVLVVLASLVFVPPSLAERPKFSKNLDYIEVTKALDELLTTKDTQAQTQGSIPKETQKKIDELEGVMHFLGFAKLETWNEKHTLPMSAMQNGHLWLHT